MNDRATELINIAVLIPYFQRAPGILRRALMSVIQQRLPPGVIIEIIVIDDGSPISAKAEIEGFHIAPPFFVTTILQNNAGVAAARNRGLDEMSPATVLVAFLDSDDIWPVHHLARAIDAVDQGCDFYFTDNCRPGHHESYCRSSSHILATRALLNDSPQKTGFLQIPRDLSIGLTLKEFPCQASTVVYKRAINDSLRFDVGLQSAGEDVLFFTRLVSSASHVYFDLDSMVHCGEGVNMFFSNFDWNSKRFLAIKVDALVTHRRIAELLCLSDRNKDWNDLRICECRADLAFHMLRNLLKSPSQTLREMNRLARMAPSAAIMLPIEMLRAVLVQLSRTTIATIKVRKSRCR